jgi:hypothetical protein
MLRSMKGYLVDISALRFYRSEYAERFRTRPE